MSSGKLFQVLAATYRNDLRSILVIKDGSTDTILVDDRNEIGKIWRLSPVTKTVNNCLKLESYSGSDRFLKVLLYGCKHIAYIKHYPSQPQFQWTRFQVFMKPVASALSLLRRPVASALSFLFPSLCCLYNTWQHLELCKQAVIKSFRCSANLTWKSSKFFFVLVIFLDMRNYLASLLNSSSYSPSDFSNVWFGWLLQSPNEGGQTTIRIHCVLVSHKKVSKELLFFPYLQNGRQLWYRRVC